MNEWLISGSGIGLGYDRYRRETAVPACKSTDGLGLVQTKGPLSGFLLVGGGEEAAGSELPGRLTYCRLAKVVKRAWLAADRKAICAV